MCFVVIIGAGLCQKGPWNVSERCPSAKVVESETLPTPAQKKAEKRHKEVFWDLDWRDWFLGF